MVIGARFWELKVTRPDDLSIPEVLRNLMNYFDIFPHHRATEGIFRRCCSQNRLDKLNFLLTFHEYTCLKKPPNPADVHHAK